MDKARDALIQEARELLEIMEHTLARVAQEGEHSDSVNEIFRVAHTIKGSASLFSFERLVSFTHLLESMLERIRSESLALDTPTVALLVECGDYIAELVDAIAAQREHTEPDPEKRARLEEAMGAMLQRNAPAAVRAQPASTPADPARRQAYVKVPVNRLDALIDLVGELVISGAAAERVAEAARNIHVLEAAQNLTERVAQLRDVALMLRMVPISGALQRLPRVVRRVAAELNKNVQLEIVGSDTELDRSMIEKLSEPLLHIVRNAVDHGIEPAEQRLLAGKPPEGTIRVSARHDGGSAVIEVSDDGRGIDPQRIREKAVEQGLVDAQAPIPDSKIERLLFEPGFTTAQRVTRVSGRGVGMDVVRKQVESLRGEIEVDSEPGRGTTVRLRLPLTLAIIDGFLLRVAHSTFVLPLDMVVECVDLSECRVHAGMVELHDERLPGLWLADVFGFDTRPRRRQNVVVIENGRQQRAALVVDALLGEFQTVIRPLGELFEKVGAFNGSTILSDGRVALILDVPHLVQRARASCPALAEGEANG